MTMSLQSQITMLRSDRLRKIRDLDALVARGKTTRSAADHHLEWLDAVEQTLLKAKAAEDAGNAP